jgi:hypothetical protein
MPVLLRLADIAARFATKPWPIDPTPDAVRMAVAGTSRFMDPLAASGEQFGHAILVQVQAVDEHGVLSSPFGHS